MKSTMSAATSRWVTSLRMSCPPPCDLDERQRLDLLGVGPHRTDGRDRDRCCRAPRASAPPGRAASRRRCPSPGPVRAPAGRRRRRRTPADRSPSRRGRTGRPTAGSGAISKVEFASTSPGTGTSGAPEITAGAVRRGVVQQLPQRGDRTERMSLGDKRYARTLGLRPARRGRSASPMLASSVREVAAVTGGQAVPELVDGPQVDARGVQREAVAVVEPGVLAEPVQEDRRPPAGRERPSGGSRHGRHRSPGRACEQPIR